MTGFYVKCNTGLKWFKTSFYPIAFYKTNILFNPKRFARFNLDCYNYLAYPFIHQLYKMVKHTQTIRRQAVADKLFELVWPFCGVGA